jgi:hypothetical protein
MPLQLLPAGKATNSALLQAILLLVLVLLLLREHQVPFLWQSLAL